MLHLFYLYKASTTLIMYNHNETMINETKQFPDGRHRLLYDMLIDKSEKFQSSYQFRALVLSVLRYVKEKPCEKENINPTIVVDIKRLLAGFILKLFIRENFVDFNLSASDLNGHYRKLAELCFDIRKFDDGTVLNSMNKEFSVYQLLDHKINLTTSYIAFSFGTLAYELFAHLSRENKWTAAHSDYLLQNKIFQKRQVKYAFHTAIDHSNNIDYDLQNLLTTEFNINNLKDKLRIQQNQGITDWIYCYSTKEALDVVNKLVEVDLEKSDIAYEDNFETITKNHVILGLEDINKHSHIFAKIPLLQYRDLTKYEMLTTHDIPITDDATLLEWQSKMVKLEKRIKVLSEVVTRPMSGRAMRFSNNAVRDILH